MSKNIVFCADGTWNGPNSDHDKDGIPDPTNVFKAFLLLSGEPDPASTLLASEQEIAEPGPDGQVAKYLHGVGDSRNVITKLVGGAFGDGIIARIVRGYTYVSRNYRPGDRIILTGFSRGAYTARALGGMIANVGLLDTSRYDVEDKALAYRMGILAWRKYREARPPARDTGGRLKGLLEKIVNFTPALALTRLQPEDTVPVDEIRAIGVWDTVGALGIPLYLDDEDSSVDLFRFADTALSPKVKFGIHAISLDEQRGDFTPTLWDSRDGIRQVLFAGAHADVGGGYPSGESGLSDIACEWMLNRLADPAIGVRLKQQPWSLKPDFLGASHSPWKQAPFLLRPSGPRGPFAFPQDIGAHVSVAQRLGLVTVAGRPVPMPNPYLPAVLGTAFTTHTNWVTA
jgi:glutathione S-transferase